MNNIEDYDDNVQSLQKQLDRLFKKSKTSVKILRLSGLNLLIESSLLNFSDHIIKECTS